jgi:hypothetical protein
MLRYTYIASLVYSYVVTKLQFCSFYASSVTYELAE